MGYLDNTSITVDAILTKKGRELLAKGRQKFNITQFALADDEVDYDLWNPAHPLGSDYYGVVIESMPVTEAVPDETQSMKYKLITLPKGTNAIPYITVSQPSIELTFGVDINSASPENIIPETKFIGNTINSAALNATLGYTATLLDTTYVDIVSFGTTQSMIGTPAMTAGDNETANSKSVVGAKFRVYVKGNVGNVGTQKSTKVIVTGNETGGRVVIPVVIKVQPATTV